MVAKCCIGRHANILNLYGLLYHMVCSNESVNHMYDPQGGYGLSPGGGERGTEIQLYLICVDFLHHMVCSNE